MLIWRVSSKGCSVLSLELLEAGLMEWVLCIAFSLRYHRHSSGVLRTRSRIMGSGI